MTPEKLMDEFREMLDARVKQEKVNYEWQLFLEKHPEKRSHWYSAYPSSSDYEQDWGNAIARRRAFAEIERRLAGG